MKEKQKEKKDPFVQLNTETGKDHELVLFNDDYNEFGFVINTLIDVCKHTPEQAEQCTYIAHYTGRCDVKRGKYEKLKQMKEGLIKQGLEAELL